MKACREARARMLPAIDGSLQIDAVLALDEHVRTCADCRARYAEAQALDAALAQLREPPVEELDIEHSVRAIRGRIDEEARPPRRAVPRWVPVAIVSAAAAALALWLLERGEDPPPPPAPVAERVPDPAPAPPAVVDVMTVAEADPVDPARLALAREEVRRELRDASAALPGEKYPYPATEFAARFDASAIELARAGWPLLRLVEGVIDDPDPVLARAALRYAGARGDRLSIRAIRDALARPEVARDAALALCDMGEAGLDALADAVDDPSLRAVVFERVATRGGAGAARFLAECAVREDARPAAVDALVRLGSDAVQHLLRLGSEGRLTTLEVLDALERTRGASDALADLVAARPRDLDRRLVLQAVGRLRPRRTLEWVAALCRDPELHGEAAACLAGFGDADALARLLALRGTWRYGEEEIEVPILSVLARDRATGRNLAQDWIRGSRRSELRGLLAFLLSNPTPSGAPALVALAASDLASASDRRSCILLAGELGLREDADALADLFARLKPSERELRAACLVSIHAIAGPDAVALALASTSPRVSGRCLALLDAREAREKPLSTLLKIARELEPALATISP